MNLGSSKVTVGVVGGAGQMGTWLRQFWERRGASVVWSDRGTLFTNQAVAETADVTFVSVPLRSTPDLIESLSPCVPEHSCLVSIASLMEPSARALVAARGEAACVHPIFGPTMASTAGLPVAVATVRSGPRLDWLIGELRAAGMDVRECLPSDHDASMAVIQALLHSTFVALCGTMSAAALPPEEALKWASPTMRVLLGLAARILGQDAGLYADMVVGNRLAPDQLEAMAAELQRLAGIARAGDRAAFEQTFRSARDSFGGTMDDLARRAEAALERFG